MKISVTKTHILTFEVKYFEDHGEEGMHEESFSGKRHAELGPAVEEWFLASTTRSKINWVIVTQPEVTIHTNPTKGA